jgi:hypothetical protein
MNMSSTILLTYLLVAVQILESSLCFFFLVKYVFLAKPKADSAQRIGVELLSCSPSNLFNFGYMSDFKIVLSNQKKA